MEESQGLFEEDLEEFASEDYVTEIQGWEYSDLYTGQLFLLFLSFINK